MDVPSSSSPTKPTPLTTPSIVELRTWLVDCGTQLSNLESQLRRSPNAPNASWTTLSIRLALISELLRAQNAGAALVDPEQQLLDLLLAHSLDRIRAMVDRLPAPPPSGEPPLPGLDGSAAKPAF